MTSVTLQEAETTLASLLEQAANGEEVVITHPDGRAIQLVPLPPQPKTPQFGIAKGTIWMADDFDAPLEDFEEYSP